MAFFRPGHPDTPLPLPPTPPKAVDVDVDLIELTRFVASISRDGFHLHRHMVPNPSGCSYHWVTVTNTTRGRGKNVCGTNRCFRLKLKNMKAVEVG